MDLVSWPAHQARRRHWRRHRPRGSSAGPASLVELPATITMRTDQGRSIKHGSDQGTDRNHGQGDDTGPASLVDLVSWPPDRTRHRP
jgi:hypothetical protein